jgi:hypothetical protein
MFKLHGFTKNMDWNWSRKFSSVLSVTFQEVLGHSSEADVATRESICQSVDDDDKPHPRCRENMKSY